MKRPKMFCVILASVFVLTAGSIFAMCPDCKDGKPCSKCAKTEENHFDKMAKELKLTDVQRQQVKAHREKHHTQMKDIMNQLAEKREALRQELQKPDTDKARVDALKNELKDLNAKRIDATVDSVTEMKQILNPEQQKIMNENMNKKHDRMKEHSDKKDKHAMDGPPDCDMGANGPPADK